MDNFIDKHSNGKINYKKNVGLKSAFFFILINKKVILK